MGGGGTGREVGKVRKMRRQSRRRERRRDGKKDWSQRFKVKVGFSQAPRTSPGL